MELDELRDWRPSSFSITRLHVTYILDRTSLFASWAKMLWPVDIFIFY